MKRVPSMTFEQILNFCELFSSVSTVSTVTQREFITGFALLQIMFISLQIKFTSRATRKSKVIHFITFTPMMNSIEEVLSKIKFHVRNILAPSRDHLVNVN